MTPRAIACYVGALLPTVLFTGLAIIAVLAGVMPNPGPCAFYLFAVGVYAIALIGLSMGTTSN